jgi:hypothetical protein
LGWPTWLARLKIRSLVDPPGLEVKTKKIRKRLMSNNLIRKGLAISATVTLALAGLVGFAAPANANGVVALEPAEGSTYTMPIGQNFALAASFDDAAQRGSESVKFKVVDSGSRLDLDTSATVVKSGYSPNYSATSNTIRLISDAAPFTWQNSAALTSNTSRTDLVVSGGTGMAPTKHFMGLVPTGTSAFSVTVQAWMDLDGDNVIDTGETASEVRTVNWVPASGIAATTTLPTPGVGDTTVASSFKTVPVINGAQLAVADSVLKTGSFSASLTNSRSGSVYDAASAALKWSEANQEFTVLHTLPELSGPATQTATTRVVNVGLTNTKGFATGDTVRILVGFEGNQTLAVDRTLLTSQLGAGAPGTVGYVKSDLTASGTVSVTSATVRVIVGDNNYSVAPFYAGTSVGTATAALVSAVTAATGLADAEANANQYISARSGSGITVPVRVNATTASAAYAVETDKELPAAGVPVRVTVSTLTDYAGLKVNGTTRASGAAFSVTTDSAGIAKFEISGGTFTASSEIVLTVVAQGVTATSQTITFDGTAAVYKVMEVGADSSYATGGLTHRSTTAGGNYIYNVSVVDQWLQPVPATVATHVKATVTSRTASTTNVALSGGKASITVNDGRLTTGNAAVSLQALLISGATETTVGSASTSNLYFYNQTDTVNFTSTAAELTELREATKTYAVNGASSSAEAWAPTTTDVNAVAVKGSITNSLSAALKLGAPVTISGPSDVLFAVDGTKVSAFGTLTFWSNTGEFNVKAYSNKVQKDSVITVSSGAASKTVKISFTASDSAADIKSALVSAVKSIKAGRTANVTMSVLDKFGNTVEVTSNTAKVTLNGSGYLTSYPTALAKGTASVTLVTGAGDFGKSVITLVADGKTAVTTDDLTVTSAIWVGPVANAVAGEKVGRVTVEAYQAKGKTVNVFVGSRRVASYVADKAEFSKSVKVKTGTRSVRVVIVGPSSDFNGVITVK